MTEDSKSSTLPSRVERAALLPLLRAMVRGASDFDVAALDANALEHALAAGLGPWAEAVSRDRGTVRSSALAGRIRGAALAAQVLGETMLDALEAILTAANRAGCKPLLLKGAASAQRYYPYPWLRTMGDLDLLVPAAQRDAVEDELRALGYVQRSDLPRSFYDAHMHSMPFWHPRQQVWVEIHSRLIHEQHALANAGLFAPDAILAGAQEWEFRGQKCRLMSAESSLAYTSVRWAEEFDAERGLWPLLDLALMSQAPATSLDWQAIGSMASREPLVATAMHLALGYLARTRLAGVPACALAKIGAHDRVTNRVSRAILWKMVDTYIVAGQPMGRIATPSNLALVWSTLLSPNAALRNLCALPVRLLFPPGQSARSNVARLLRALTPGTKERPGSLRGRQDGMR